MANVSDYTFLNMGRIGLDKCSLSETEKQNVKNADYTLTNHFSTDCSMSKPMDLALSQPSMFYKGSHQVGMGGCNIEQNSSLLLGSQLTHGSEKITLNERQKKQQQQKIKIKRLIDSYSKSIRRREKIKKMNEEE